MPDMLSSNPFNRPCRHSFDDARRCRLFPALLWCYPSWNAACWRTDKSLPGERWVGSTRPVHNHVLEGSSYFNHIHEPKIYSQRNLGNFLKYDRVSAWHEIKRFAMVFKQNTNTNLTLGWSTKLKGCQVGLPRSQNIQYSQQSRRIGSLAEIGIGRTQRKFNGKAMGWNQVLVRSTWFREQRRKPFFQIDIVLSKPNCFMKWEESEEQAMNMVDSIPDYFSVRGGALLHCYAIQVREVLNHLLIQCTF